MTPLQPAEIAGIVTETARLTRELYVFPEVGGKLADLLADRLAEGRYDGAADPQTLGRLVTEDLQSVSQDRHLRLKFHHEEVPATENGAVLAELHREADLSLGGVPLVERLGGGVARLKLAPIVFPLGLVGAEPLTAGFNLVAPAEALILDLRECVGGHPEAVAHVSAYLLDEPTHLTTLYDREDGSYRQLWSPAHVPGPRFGGEKPLYVLISAATFSGGEALAYDLQQQGRAVVVGERSGGGANPRQGFTLHPQLEATIPVSRSINPVSGTNWEGVGITPDIETDPADALDVAHRAALAAVAARDTDTPSAAEARRLLAGAAEPARDGEPI
ncbi:S41 family peptidase [Kitasatospora viridis]|uniref:Peptidase S41-like protein n=1 Tax=Kitasatospora viridis TaxID=281105 RepID=A0A561SEA4_9ACTN|nr:S41 family peptidase [Kitasatospora viridis]TWF73204.1 peptidase S41-like protein [Kitasatospora viridis]